MFNFGVFIVSANDLVKFLVTLNYRPRPYSSDSQLFTTQTQHQASPVLIICIPISRHDGNHEVFAVIESKISPENQVLYAKKNIIQSASYIYCKLHVVLLSTFMKKNFSYLHYWNEVHVFCFS